MWVICISNTLTGYSVYNKKDTLTQGKKYLVQNSKDPLSNFSVYLITNDFGEDIYYDVRRFITIEEHRETILNNLL